MNRRDFFKGMVASVATAMIPRRGVAAQDGSSSENGLPAKRPGPIRAGRPQQIAMLVYPQFTALDLVGPHTFLSGLMDAEVNLVWKNKKPIPTDRGNLTIVPSMTMEECPKDLDLIMVPGGLEGTIAIMRDDETLSFLADRGSRAQYVTSVCTGSLILGAAGLLKGYKATSHWAFRDLLPILGAIPMQQRVVEDRNRITGAGVTSGIDFGLTVAARMRDQQYAEMLQLLNEYDPHPPFHAGTPATAGPIVTRELVGLIDPGIASARTAAVAAAQKFAKT